MNIFMAVIISATVLLLSMFALKETVTLIDFCTFALVIYIAIEASSTGQKQDKNDN